ncbi:hypothetical protein P9112_002871 [Eukaryota sp. TZLM1-RC]
MAPKAKKLSNDEAAQRAMDYINNNNRPFGAQNIVDGLGGAVAIGQMKKVLTELVDKEKITSQDYGKNKVYLPIQNPEDAPSQDELDALDCEIKSLRDQISQISDEISVLQKEAKTLAAEPEDLDLDNQIELLTSQTTKMQSRLKSLVEENNVVDPHVRKSTVERFNLALKQWQRRKCLCMNVVNMIADGMGTKPKEVSEAISLETDSDVEIAPPNKRKKLEV